MRLGSTEYMREVGRRSNSDAEYRQLAKGQNETYTLVLEVEPHRSVHAAIVAGSECHDGEFVKMWSEARPTLFTLSAPYGT